MQLKNIRATLAVASCTLLGTAPAFAQEKTDGFFDNWKLKGGLLFYNESDGRVTAIEPVIAAQKDFADERILNLKFVADVLTGASANGAVPSDTVQVFTTPSGNSTYEAQAGEVPLDDTFKDTRLALSGDWSQPLGSDKKWLFGGNVSAEHDYVSAGLNSALAWDVNEKNTTFSLGGAVAFDSINPEGEIPLGLSDMSQRLRSDSSDTKTTVDLLLGVTQVLGKKTLLQFNYSLSNASGYLTDPYKVVSVVDASTGRPLQQLYESRPDSRTKHALYWQLKHQFERDIVDVSYRYMFDDWDIQSHTIDLKYRWKFAEDQYLEPQLRYYTQDQADFYKRFMVEGDALPEHVSADYRLGNLDTVTLGLKYGTRLWGHQASVRLSYYQQSNDSQETPFGILSQYDLNPDVNAVMATFEYNF